MDKKLLKTAVKYGLQLASLTLAVYILLGFIVRQFVDTWRPMEHYTGMMLGLFIGTWFFQTWIRYSYLKNKKLMKDKHDFIMQLVRDRGEKIESN